MSKRSLLAILAVVVAAVLAFAIGRRSAPETARRAVGSAAIAARPAGAAPGATSSAEVDADRAAGSGKAPRSEVRRLGSDERRRLGEQIAEARQRARAGAATAQGAAGEPPDDESVPLDGVGKPLNDALHDAIGTIATCFEQQLGSDAVRDAVELLTAKMTMTSDPDLGTVIDTAQVTDAAGRPLTAKLDECLRDTVDTLALPPATRGGRIHVQYSFRF